MKIKNLKYILCFLSFLLFSLNSVAFSECNNPPWWVSEDECEIYWWSWYFDSDTNCCIQWNSCLVSPDSNWHCPDNNQVVDSLWCCVDYVNVTCNSPLITPMVIDNNPRSCSYWYSLQNWCCACDLFAWDSGCWDGYSPNSQGCCRPASQMCGENQYMPSWSTWCAECEIWTKPNEEHTKCVCDPDIKCCGVQLNTVIPFIWDCIEMNAESSRDNTTNVNSVTAFPILMQWLMKIVMSVIMIFSFIMIIVAWLLIVSGAFGWNWFTTGKKIIKNVIISLILLWSSWLILSLINPSFFGG